MKKRLAAVLGAVLVSAGAVVVALKRRSKKEDDAG